MRMNSGLYNRMPEFVKSMKWIFDPAKCDIHVRLTSISGGITGAAQKIQGAEMFEEIKKII